MQFTVDDAIKFVFATIAAVGGLGVILAGIFYWISKLVSDQIFQRTEAQFTKELEEIKKAHSIEIENLRAELAERKELIASAQSALGISHTAAQERVLKSLELCWDLIVQIRNWVEPANFVFWYIKSQPAKIDDLKKSPMLALLNSKNRSRTFEFRKALESSRPFLGERLWDMYTGYLIFGDSMFEKALVWKESGKPFDLLKDKDGERGFMLLVPFKILGRARLDELLEKDIEHAPSGIMNEIESKILDEMNEWIFGKKISELRIDQQQNIANLLSRKQIELRAKE